MSNARLFCIGCVLAGWTAFLVDMIWPPRLPHPPLAVAMLYFNFGATAVALWGDRKRA